MSDAYLSHVIYLKHVVHREEKRKRAEAAARITKEADSSPVAWFFGRLKMLRQSDRASEQRVEPTAMPPFDLDLA